MCNRLLASDLGLQRAITCTTRAPRPGEVDGKDYYFLTKDQFESKKAADEFLEWANVYGNFYGTLKSEIIRRLELGQDVIVSVDVQGVASIAKMAKNDPVLSASFVSLFIALPSVEALRKRLEGRGSDSPEVIQKRLDTARAEMQTCGGFDYILLSGSMDEDYERAYAVVLAEKMKRSRVSQSDLEKYIGLFH